MTWHHPVKERDLILWLSPVSIVKLAKQKITRYAGRKQKVIPKSHLYIIKVLKPKITKEVIYGTKDKFIITYQMVV